jgi:hypothetical protein
MFPIEIPVHFRQGTGKPAVAFGVIEKHRPQMKEPGAATSCREDFVKNLVSPRVFFLVVMANAGRLLKFQEPVA